MANKRGFAFCHLRNQVSILDTRESERSVKPQNITGVFPFRRVRFNEQLVRSGLPLDYPLQFQSLRHSLRRNDLFPRARDHLVTVFGLSLTKWQYKINQVRAILVKSYLFSNLGRFVRRKRDAREYEAGNGA